MNLLIWTQTSFALTLNMERVVTYSMLIQCSMYVSSNVVLLSYRHVGSTNKTNRSVFYICKQIFCLPPVQKAPVFCLSFRHFWEGVTR